MSEWAEMEEEILEKLGIFYGEDAYVLFSPMQMAAALAEIRRLRESFVASLAMNAQARSEGARAMQERCAGLVQGWVTRLVDGTQAASAIRALKPEDV